MSDRISGAIVFTGERSSQGYRLNKMAMSLTSPDNRARFKADEAAYLASYGLDAEETDLVHRRDWKGMMEHGASIYLIIKIAGSTGHTLPEVGAHTAGITA